MDSRSQQANAQGLAALRAGDAALAVTHFAAAIEADPGAGSLYRNLAHAHRLCGDDAGERAALERALTCDQRDVQALIRLAQLHERRDERRDALHRWSAVVQLGAQIATPSPDLVALLDHGAAYCAAQTDGLARQIAADRKSVV